MASSSMHASWKQLAWWRRQLEIFSALLALCAGNSPVNSPHKGQWRGALMFPLICTLINGWRNDREVGDLRRCGAHHDVTVLVTDRWCTIFYVDILNFIQIWISQNFKGECFRFRSAVINWYFSFRGLNVCALIRALWYQTGLYRFIICINRMTCIPCSKSIYISHWTKWKWIIVTERNNETVSKCNRS